MTDIDQIVGDDARADPAGRTFSAHDETPLAILRSCREPTRLSLVHKVIVMPKIVNIHEAKTHLSRLVDDVAAGAEVIIAKAGKPMARLTPMTVTVKAKRLGLLKGKITVRDDFNSPLPDDVLASFEGR